MVTNRLETPQLNEREQKQLQLLNAYFGSLQKEPEPTEEEWYLTDLRHLRRLLKDSNSKDAKQLWVMRGDIYQDFRQDPEYMNFKRQQLGTFLRELILSGRIASAAVNLMGTEEQCTQDVLVADLKVNLQNGGNILINLTSSPSDKDLENCRLRFYGGASPLRSSVVELNEAKEKNFFPRSYVFPAVDEVK